MEVLEILMDTGFILCINSDLVINSAIFIKWRAEAVRPVFLQTLSRHCSFAVIPLVAWSLSSCAAFRTLAPPSLPATTGQTYTSYSYIPLDPLPVSMTPGVNCNGVFAGFDAKGEPEIARGNPIAILDSLPDQAVRIAVGQYDASGTLVFGPAKIGLSGQSYQVVLDYISVDTANVPVYIERLKPDGKEISPFDASFPSSLTSYRVFRDPESSAFISGAKTGQEKPAGEQVIIPVYVGVGLRLTASVTVTNASANYRV